MPAAFCCEVAGLPTVLPMPPTGKAQCSAQSEALGEDPQKQRDALLRYDLFLELGLEWPALTVDWLAEEELEHYAKIAFATQTDGSEPCQVLVAELTCAASLQRSGAWKTWGGCDHVSQCRGFGARPLQDKVKGKGKMQGVAAAPLRVAARMELDREVNRVVACPLNPRVLAAKDSSGTVTLLDYKKAASESAGFLASFRYPQEAVDGFALAWCHKDRGLLGTGGRDGSLSIWDTLALSGNRPLFAISAHDASLNDLSFSAHGPQLATVGEDRRLATWDLRRGPSKLHQFEAEVESLAVDWSPMQEHLLATGGKDHLVRVWDLRRCQKPLSLLRGHHADVLQLRWCPTDDARAEGMSASSLLASSSQDGTAILWNLAQANDKPKPDEAETSAIFFLHSMHQESVPDLSWCTTGRLLMCSVSEDYTLQVWQPSVSALASDEEEEVRSSKAPKPVKRAKLN